MENSSVGLEEVCEDKQVCAENRRHIVELINMSMQDLYDLAYKQGYSDAMTKASDLVRDTFKTASV